MNTTNIVVAVRNRRLLNDEVDSIPPLVVEGHNVVEVKGHRFTYDYVFGKDSSNQEVYEKVVKNKIPNLFEGFNVTILAYGSTGSGKTYTMGTDYDDQIPIDQVGIIPQGIDDIFKMIDSEKDNKEFVVKVSYVEIYNEEIYDLGVPKGKFQDQKNKLQICERDADKGAKEIITIVEVRNLTQKVVHNTKEALQFLMKGSGRRHIGETAKNKFSSRSHAILNVLVQQTDKSTGSGKSAKFQLVDLAGSERSSTSKTSGIRLKEGTQINKSLFQLSSVIMALTTSKQSFINYRSSKLTHLLRDSLGGNTYTVMIACVNPSSTSAEETLSTLRYAHTARKIKNQPKVNVDTATEQLKQLQKENEVLSAELYKLRSAKLNAANSIFDSKASQLLESAYFKVNSLNEKLLEIEENDKELRNTLKTFSDTLNEIAVDMTPLAVTDNDIKVQKKRIEAVQMDCYKLWLARCQDAVQIDVKDNESYKNIGNADEEESELNNSGDTSEEESENPFGSGKKLFKEVKDRQAVRVNKLSSIQFALQVKENMCEQLNFLQDHIDSSITEGKEILLENQIKQLIQDKTELTKRMETEKLFSKENKAKVEKYEEKLKELQEELQKIKRSLKMKWETTEKVNMLRKEIEELKKHRINLIKERNQVSKQCMRIEQEKNKDIMQLKRKERKQELQRTRMAENYESKIRVLEARVSKYEISRLTQYKNKNIKVEKPKSTLVNTGESIEAKVKTAIENNLMKLELEEMEQDADSLEQNIKKMEELSPDENKDTYILEMKAKLNVLLEKIGTMKKNSLETKTKSCVLLDSLPNLPAEAKTVVKTLLNKCVKAKVELTKHLNECNENFEKNKNDMEKKMQLLINESELATQDLEKKIEYLESQLNLKQQEELQNQEAKEFKDLTNFPSKELQLETNTSDADGKGETEDLDKKIQNLQATCDEKHAEVAELKKQIKDLQNRKRTRKWLTRLSSEDADTSEVHGKESMLEAYFSTDNEESFSNDPNDPDWRATPLHKQAKRSRFQVSAENPEMISKVETDPSVGSLESMDMSSENDFLMPAKPKNKCHCVGDCKSNRCKCKKTNVVCTEACKCMKTRCNNV